MEILSIAVAELFLCFTGVVYYNYGYEHYVANAAPFAGKSMSFYSNWSLHLYVYRIVFEITDQIYKSP